VLPGGSIVLNFTPATVNVPEPVIQSITGAGTGSVTISWSAVNGVSYRLQYKNSLSDASWSELAPVVANGNTASSTDTGANSQTRFYRVRAQ
ncbi:MAG: hypothetical protein ACK4UN_17095, partial [Limisphaerales bacterium]